MQRPSVGRFPNSSLTRRRRRRRLLLPRLQSQRRASKVILVEGNFGYHQVKRPLKVKTCIVKHVSNLMVCGVVQVDTSTLWTPTLSGCLMFGIPVMPFSPDRCSTKHLQPPQQSSHESMMLFHPFTPIELLQSLHSSRSLPSNP